MNQSIIESNNKYFMQPNGVKNIRSLFQKIQYINLTMKLKRKQSKMKNKKKTLKKSDS
jgi:hypothetical protein